MIHTWLALHTSELYSHKKMLWKQCYNSVKYYPKTHQVESHCFIEAMFHLTVDLESDILKKSFRDVWKHLFFKDTLWQIIDR